MLYLRVKYEQGDHGAQNGGVVEYGGADEGAVPLVGLGFLAVGHPSLGPRVRKVDDEDQLYQNEEKASDHAEVHPGRTERALRDEERPDYASDH